MIWSILALTILTPILLYAEQRELNSYQMGEINRFNSRPLIKFYDEKKLKSFAKIDEKSAKEIAFKECNLTKPSFIRLKRRGRILYYEVASSNLRVKINALDGEIITCKGDK